MDEQHAWIVVVRNEPADGEFSNRSLDEQEEKRDADVGDVHVLELAGPRFVVGRSKTCELTLGDTLLGRRHLALAQDGGAWEAIDGGSTHGIALNGTQIDRGLLTDGDVLSFGTTILQFFAGPAAHDRARTAADAARATAAAPKVRRTPAARAELVLHDAVSAGIDRATTRRHPLALLSLRGPQGTHALTVWAGMTFQNLAFAIVRCEADVGVLLCADITEARRHGEAFRRVAEVMARKSATSPDVVIGIAVFDGAAPLRNDYRSNATSTFIQHARTSVE